jgi:hypothetical protein
MFGDIEIAVASPPDRDGLVAELFTSDGQIAELRRDGMALTMEIYPRPDGAPWQVEMSQLFAAMAVAAGNVGDAHDDSSTNLRFPHLFAVMRVDDFAEGPVEDRVSLVSAFGNAHAADDEAIRLSHLPSASESRYVVKVTRIKG